MEIKVNQTTQIQQTAQPKEAPQSDDTFKFTLMSRIGESELQDKIGAMLEEITRQGKTLAKKRDIREMKRYRSLIKGFLNEIVTHSHSFARENFLDRRGRHRVYGIIRLVDENLDALARALLSDEKDDIDILAKIGEIEGLILDIFT